MIVPIAAGSSLDVFGRVIAERMAKSLGQPIIIENVSGAVPHRLAWAFRAQGHPSEHHLQSTATAEALADPAARSRIDDLGFEVFPREQQTGDALRAFVRASAEKWWPIIKELGIKTE
jgi:tripartite-type tricarboxylate transporter receptor subunit TctC